MNCDYFLSALGLMAMLAELPCAAFPDRMKTWLIEVAAIPERFLRLAGILAVAADIALPYRVRGRAGNQ